MVKRLDLTRRGALLAAAGVGAGLAGCSQEAPRFDPLPAPDGPFKHGVASGDPDQTSLVVWTAVTADGDVRLTLEVATDESFNTIVERRELGPREGVIAIDGARPVKALVEGLEPGREYVYRFRQGDEVSP
ncbi:MAG TPA: alkaline phosphatase, partial [Oceanicaulis sp.]|nr:alkaline phosphatase [Oceanicaulis sp.]